MSETVNTLRQTLNFLSRQTDDKQTRLILADAVDRLDKEILDAPADANQPGDK